MERGWDRENGLIAGSRHGMVAVPSRLCCERIGCIIQRLSREEQSSWGGDHSCRGLCWR
jgi:hypothetical protein